MDKLLKISLIESQSFSIASQQSSIYFEPGASFGSPVKNFFISSTASLYCFCIIVHSSLMFVPNIFKSDLNLVNSTQSVSFIFCVTFAFFACDFAFLTSFATLLFVSLSSFERVSIPRLLSCTDAFLFFLIASLNFFLSPSASSTILLYSSDSWYSLTSPIFLSCSFITFAFPKARTLSRLSCGSLSSPIATSPMYVEIPKKPVVIFPILKFFANALTVSVTDDINSPPREPSFIESETFCVSSTNSFLSSILIIYSPNASLSVSFIFFIFSLM